MQPLFLPQIHRTGCDEIFTTFALALAAVFRSVCSIANSSSASAGITQLYGCDFHGHADDQSRNARWSGLDQSAFRQISPRRNQVHTWGSIFVGSSSRSQTGGQTLTNEA